MTVYFLCMIISCIFTYLDTIKISNTIKKNRQIGFCGWIAILIPSFLAAFREVGVGSDTNGYGSIMFYVATKSHSLMEYFNSNNPYVSGSEPGYRIFVYLMSRISDKITFQFFMIEFIIMFFIYKSLKDNQLGRKTWIGVMLYYTLFLGFSFNLMRQCLAISVIFWATKFIYARKWKTFTIIILIVSTIQLTSIVSLSLYPLYIIFSNEERIKYKKFYSFLKKYRWLLGIITVASALAILINGKKLMHYIIHLQLKSSYAAQLGLVNTAGFNASSFILMSMFLVPFLLNLRKLLKKEKLFCFLFIVVLLSVLLWQLSMVSQEAYRIALYFWMMIIILVPKGLCGFSKKNINILTFYYITLSNFYFVYYAVIIGANKIFPYTSSLI